MKIEIIVHSEQGKKIVAETKEKAIDPQYEHVVTDYLQKIKEGLEIVQSRINHYGDSSYQPRTLDYDLKASYFRLQRKFQRIDNMTWNAAEIMERENIDLLGYLEGIREEYLDAMNYCVMALQLLDKNFSNQKRS